MFPGPGAVVYRNEAGEPLGWDYPDQGPPDVDAFYEAQDPYLRCERCHALEDETDAFAWPGEEGFDELLAMERTGRSDRDYEWCHNAKDGEHRWGVRGY